MRRELGLLMAFSLICMCAGGSAVRAADIIDTDFSRGDDYSAIQLLTHKSDRVSGMLPQGWQDDSGWADLSVNYELQEEEGLRFLRMSVRDIKKGQGQLAFIEVPRITEKTYYTLTIRLRAIGSFLTCFGLRRTGAPYSFFWEHRQRFPMDWSTYTWRFELEPQEEKVGFWFVIHEEGALDIASLKLQRMSAGEYAASIQNAFPEGSPANLLRHSRLPLGLPCGFNLLSMVPDGDGPDEVLVRNVGDDASPSGAPALSIRTPRQMSVYLEPFAVPFALEGHAASAYLKGNARGALVVQAEHETIARTEFRLEAKDGWTRITAPFTPVPMALAHRLRLYLEAESEVLLDGLQVEKGAIAGVLRPQMECEVALASGTEGEAAAVDIFFAGEKPVVRYAVTGAKAGQVFRATASSLYGRKVYFPAVQTSGEFMQTGELVIEPEMFGQTPFGPFRIEAWVEDNAGRRLSTFGEHVVNVLPRPRYWMRDAPDSPFGVHMYASRRQVQIAKAIGINWVRLHDAGLPYTGWYHLEPHRKGEWVFRDERIKCYREHGVKVLGVLSTAPKWASYLADVNRRINEHTDPFYQPKNYEDFADYVRVVVERYKDEIDTWDVWNEPWIDAYLAVGHDPARDTGRGGYIGSVDPGGDYVRMVAIADKIAKEINPRIKILGVNTAGDDGKYGRMGGGDWSELFRRKGGMTFTDVISFHDYVGGALGFPDDKVAEGYNRAISPLLEDGKPLKPVWHTEGCATSSVMGEGIYAHSYPFLSDEDVFHTSERTCRYAVSLLGLGAQKLFMYSMHCYNEVPGSRLYRVMINSDGRLHPSGAAYAILTNYLEGRTLYGHVQLAPGTWAYIFEGDGKSVAAIMTQPGYGWISLRPGHGLALTDIFGNPHTTNENIGRHMTYAIAETDAAGLEKLLLNAIGKNEGTSPGEKQ